MHSLLFLFLCFLSFLSLISCDRSVYSLDSSHRFQLADALQCPSSDINEIFPIDYTNRQCFGLTQYTAAKSAMDCALACCSMGTDGCSVYEWCSGGECDPPSSCWIGHANNCSTESASGWISKGRPSSSVPVPGDVCNDPRCMPDFDDHQWRTVDIPHDFVVEGTFNQSADMSHGYLPYGVGWYRKYFSVPVSLRSSPSIWIDFEGVQTGCTVWLNGIVIGTNAYGYTPFRFYLNASTLKYGANEKNVLVVKADATKPDGWWYDGGGIYRHIYLTAVSSPIYLTPDGVYSPSTVNSVITFNELGQPFADSTVHPSIEVTNPSDSDQSFGALFEIFDSTNKLIASSTLDNQIISALSTKQFFSPNIWIEQAALWHLVPSPALYWLTVTIKSSSGDIDQLTIRFGIRQTKWDGATGFYLNGQRTKIKGMANHQDFGGLGVAIPDHFQWYRIKKLQEMGANGWRTAHNPPNPALLDAADQLGFLVWDENHRNGQADQMTVLLRRDRNHPSIIIWSLCNEVLCKTNDNVGDAKKLKQIAREIDPLGGRVISANFNDFVGPNTPLDVQGFDYYTYQYDEWHSQAPNIPSISSETSSAVSDRDEYSNDAITGHVSGYDVNYPSWGQSAEQAWGGIGETNGQGILTRDFIAGGFTWTGFDYKGEPTPYQWPNINSHFGIIDIAGFPKDRYYWYHAWFNANYHNKTAIYVFPHWNNWTPGQIVNVWVYSNGEEIELKLNGQSLGRKTMQTYSHVEWNVSYQPGVIEAIAYNAGSSVPIVSMHRNTTGSASRIKLAVEFSSPSSTLFSSCGHSEIALISASILDSFGQVVPTASNQIQFLVKGAGKIVGTANGDPSSHTGDKSTSRSAYHGLASLLVQPIGQAGETVIVQALSDGLSSGEIELTLTEADGVAKEWWCKNYPSLY